MNKTKQEITNAIKSKLHALKEIDCDIGDEKLAEWSKIKNEKSLLVKFYKTLVQLREEMDEGEAEIGLEDEDSPFSDSHI